MKHEQHPSAVRGPMKIEPVSLQGDHVRLEPVAPGHLEELWSAGHDPQLWAHMPTPVRNREEMAAYLKRALGLAEQGTGQYFVQRSAATGEIVGGTGYWNADRTHRRVEIGGTWLTPAWQRSPVNTEAKLLLLRHAFDVLGCIRVEFKTDSLNAQSRRALQRIGAAEEGTFHNHMIMSDGRLRHSVYYAIVPQAWPAIRERLQALLEPRAAADAPQPR